MAGRNPTGDLAIIGMACRFPGANHYEEFWANLRDGVDSVRTVPVERWETVQSRESNDSNSAGLISNWGAFLDQVDGFDSRFFNISPREAVQMDPQQRLLLEETWHCVEDAGVGLATLRKARTAVSVGVMTNDYLQLLLTEKAPIEPFSCLGNYDAILANRISYVLDLHGESKTIGAACASSLVALHDARRILLNGEADFAISAGVNIICHPWKYVSFSKSHMLSLEGCCRAFDAGADGYVPGEGVAVVLLQRLEEARRDGNRIHGILKGSAVNHVGNAPSITSPRVDTQRELIRAAWRSAGVSSRSITYIEAHGTGTSLGDPIEIEGLRQAFASEGPSSSRHCAVGSVKTNIGHLEAAAGIAGVIKVLLMMRHKKIPPSLHLRQINPMIDFDQSPFWPVTALSEWRVGAEETPRRAGVSSFGFGGVSAHVILEAAIEEEVSSKIPSDCDASLDPGPESLFLFSARSSHSLRGLLLAWIKYTQSESFVQVTLRDLSHTLAKGREFWEYRCGSIVSCKQELIDFLRTEATRLDPDSNDKASAVEQRAVVLRVGNSLSVRPGRIEQLLSDDSTFEVHYKDCLKRLGGTALDRDPEKATEFAALYALVRRVIAGGISPLYICGEGLGNAVGLAIAGSLPLESALAVERDESFCEQVELQALMLPYYDPISRQILSPFRVTPVLLQDWLRCRSLSQLDWVRALDKARSLMQNQRTFIHLVEEWDALLNGDSVRRMLFDNEICSLENSGAADKRFLLFVILEVCFRRLSQKWQFNSQPIESRGSRSLVELVITGLLSKEQLIELCLADNPDFANIASRVNLNAIEDSCRGSVLAEKLPECARPALSQERDARWLSEIVNLQGTEIPDPNPNTLVLQIGTPSKPTQVTATLNPTSQNGIRSSLRHALLTLWLQGASIPWPDWFESDFHKVALPEYVFDRKSYWVSKGTGNGDRIPRFDQPPPKLIKQKVPVRDLEKSVTLRRLDSATAGIAFRADAAVEDQKIISLQVQNGVALLRMCDEDHNNAFTDSFVAAFRRRLQEIGEDDAIKVVVLTNTGPYFCSGADAALLKRFRAKERSFSELACFYRGILECPVPFIHAVAGHAIGGGFAFSLFGDFVILAKESYYSANFLNFGFTPGMGATLIIPEKLGANVANRMMFTGENLRGAELAELGAPLQFADKREVLTLSLRLADQLAAKSRVTLMTLKGQVTGALLSKLDRVIDEELKGHELTLSQSERSESIQGFNGNGFGDSFTAASGVSEESCLVESQSMTTRAASVSLSRDGLSINQPAAKGRLDRAPAKRLEILRQAIRSQICQLLMLPATEMDEDQSFKELGFDSVLAVEMVKELNRCYGLNLDTTILYERTTPRTLLDYLVSGPLAPTAQDSEARGTGEDAGQAIDIRRQRSVLADETAKRQEVGNNRFADTDIAVIGMAGRFPGANDLDAFWRNLAAGIDSISTVPSDRWDCNLYYDPDPDTPGKTNSRWGGYLEDVDCFDSMFFKISPREAESIDPQQRLFLEEAWKALENAGYCERNLRGRQCGVFVGATAGDYSLRLRECSVDNTADAFLGSAPSILASRISYTLGLTGASLAIDTACSSSLVAVHQACQSIIAGDCDMALAGGVSILTTPQLYVRTSKARMLSPTGRCRAFSDDADGIVLSEGVGVVVLKPLKLAVKEGDFVYGVIRASGVNQDGRTNGITAPNGQSQATLEINVYERAGISPENLQLVEAHGTGTRLGDPIEVRALTTAFTQYTNKRQFCALGSVKTNIGHTTTAAGIASLIKVLLAMKHGKIPASLHFAKANQRIRFEESPFYVNDRVRDWQTGGDARRAAVSSFGFSGTNCHLVVEDYPRFPVATFHSPQNLFILSAKTPQGLRAYAEKWISFLDGAEAAQYSLVDIAYTVQTGREAMEERLAAVIASCADIREALGAFLAGNGGERSFLTGRAANGHGRGALSSIIDGGAADAREEWFRIAKHWCSGGEVSWEDIYVSVHPRRVPVPTYPFARERHWVTSPQPNRSMQTGEPLKIPWEDLDAVLADLESGEIGVDQALAAIGIEERT